MNRMRVKWDLKRFKQRVCDPRRSKEELVKFLENVEERGEFAKVVKDELYRRFPGWDNAERRAGWAQTRVVFRGLVRRFPTAKEGYLWLVERFIQAHPVTFTDLNWEIEFVAKGQRRNYFGRSPTEMFYGTPSLADNPNNYHRLTNGWYADVNLRNDQKFTSLCKLAALGEFKYREEWECEIEGQPGDDELPDIGTV